MFETVQENKVTANHTRNCKKTDSFHTERLHSVKEWLDSDERIANRDEAGLIRKIAPALAVITLLYLFLLSISLLGSAFKLFGKGFAEQLVTTTSDPFVSLVIGILVTSLVQSSSVTTSLLVGLVGGGAINLAGAIPMVMGANIGTTVTNSMVSLGQITRKDDFRRAFSASVVHDVFNLMAVIVIFPFQYKFNILGYLSEEVATAFTGVGGVKFTSPIKAIVKPTAGLLIDLMGENPWIVTIFAAVLLFFSLNFLVKTLKGVVLAKIQVFFDKVIFRNPAISIVFGLIFTVLVQSSSITTSLVVPLAGAGILSLYQVFPYTLGANVGTTFTAILASLATGSTIALAVALAHLFFNIIGIVLIWPIRVIPIKIAVFLAEIAIKNRMFPFVFIALMFYVIPLAVVFLVRS